MNSIQQCKKETACEWLSLSMFIIIFVSRYITKFQFFTAHAKAGISFFFAETKKRKVYLKGGFPMSINLKEKFNTGLTPQQFMDGMTKNKEAFHDWYERFSWDENERAFFQSLQERNDLHCLILASDWCGDVVRNVPVIFRALAETNIPTEVLIMENHLDLMDQFLTMGGRSIPVVIFTDTEGNVLGKWGPRPAHVQAIMVAFKKENPDRNAPNYDEKIKETRAKMLVEYGEDTRYQQVIIKELHELLAAL
jgi:hypothetical protein